MRSERGPRRSLQKVLRDAESAKNAEVAIHKPFDEESVIPRLFWSSCGWLLLVGGMAKLRSREVSFWVLAYYVTTLGRIGPVLNRNEREIANMCEGAGKACEFE